MKRFHSFCTTCSITTPFPLTEHLLCCYAAYLADQGLAPQTVKSYLAALRNAQISLGLPDPRDQSSLPRLKRVQAGISRLRLLKGGQKPRIRLPVTPLILHRIKASLGASDDPNQAVIWAVACAAFFGFFRLGELLPASAAAFNPATGLAWGDVALDSHESPRMIQFHLKVSKCDQFGSGADVVIGSTGSEICPVTAIMSFVAARGSRPGPFFIDASGKAVTKA